MRDDTVKDYLYGRIEGDTLYFWGGSLTLQWPAKFQWEGKAFHSAWHALSYALACDLGNTRMQQQLLTKHSIDGAKRYFTRHNSEASPDFDLESIVISILLEREVQHAYIKEEQDKFKDLELVYCGDDVVGIGLPFWHKDVLDSSKWKHDNDLGRWLHAIRDNYHNR